MMNNKPIPQAKKNLKSNNRPYLFESELINNKSKYTATLQCRPTQHNLYSLVILSAKLCKTKKIYFTLNSAI